MLRRPSAPRILVFSHASIGSVYLERVLVCILAQTRAHQVAWPSFKRQVLDELGADLALAVTFDEKYDYANPYWQQAKYRWTAPEPSDVGDAFDLAQRWLCHQQDVAPTEWRSMLRIRGTWLGGIRSANPQPSHSAHLFFCRWLLLHGLQQDGILERYDRFVVTRSDFIWLCPHPPLSILDRGSIWIPDGEQYGGFTDRHLVVSREDAASVLSLIDDILLRPDELYEEMKHRSDWNPERFIALHLARKGLLARVKLFPYVMYSARGLRDTPSTWTPGRFEPSVRHVVKYPSEFRVGQSVRDHDQDPRGWEKGDWRRLDPELAAARYLPSTWNAMLGGRRVTSSGHSGDLAVSLASCAFSDGRCRATGGRPHQRRRLEDRAWTTWAPALSRCAKRMRPEVGRQFHPPAIGGQS